MLKNQNRLAEAQRELRQAYDIFASTLGTEHPRTRSAQQDLIEVDRMLSPAH